MIRNIRAELIKILDESDWMDDETKVVAKEKVKVIFTLVFALTHSYSINSNMGRMWKLSTPPMRLVLLTKMISFR